MQFHNHPLKGIYKRDNACWCYWMSSFIKWLLHTFAQQLNEKMHKLCHKTKWINRASPSPSPPPSKWSVSSSLFLPLPLFFLSRLLLVRLSTNCCCFLSAYHYLNCNHIVFANTQPLVKPFVVAHLPIQCIHKTQIHPIPSD